MEQTNKIRVFNYIPELGCFVVDDEFARIADYLGLSEWHPAVWMGRLFMMDNDFGEHWFDNWEAREELRLRAEAIGLDADRLMIIDPDRFQDGKDGPCHSSAFRTRFWKDVLMSLAISLDIIFDEARAFNERTKELLPDEYLTDLEDRIRRVMDNKGAGKPGLPRE